MSLIEEQRENLTALSEPVEVEVSLKDYEQLDNLPSLNGNTIIGNVLVNETVEIRDVNDRSNYTITELRTLTNNSKALTYKGTPIIAYDFTGTGEDRKFLFTYCEAGSNGSQMWFWRKYVDVDKYIVTVGRTNLPLGINGKTWALPPDTEITLYAGDIQAEDNWSPTDDKDLATKKYVDDNKTEQVQVDWNEADNTAVDYIKNKPATMPPSSHTHTKSDITDFPSLATVATSGSYNDLLNQPTIPDISGCEVTTNKVTAIDNTSTDTQYPSAKCVYDELQTRPSMSSSTETIAVADWNGGTTAIISVTGVTASNIVMVSPSPSDYSDYASANIRCTAQASGQLTFTCDTTPSADIDVNIAIWG